jgi:hypothetical protein
MPAAIIGLLQARILPQIVSMNLTGDAGSK